MSALMFLALNGYDQAMLPMGYQDVDLTKRLSAVGKARMVYGADETGNVLNSVMEEVAKKKRRIREIEAKVSNVALEHKNTPWALIHI